jgi:hypothetical protein
MNEKIISLEIEIDDEIQDELGVDVISIVDHPAIEVDFHAFSDVEFISPNPTESNDEFIQRCMSELDIEFPDQDQRYAVCNSFWEDKNMKFESYDDYPREARENACKAVIFADENGWGDCGTQVGKVRAQQLCMGEKISKETISRMASFERHRQHKDVPYEEGCGGLMWDAWGGDEGIAWAQRKLDQLQELCDESCDHQFHPELDKLRDMIIEFAEDPNNGEYITEDDVMVNLKRTEFISVKEVLDGLRAFDLLKRLGIKKEEEPQVYFRYMGATPQRKFCRAMMNLSLAGKIFTKAEIDRMSSLNPQFAPRGQSSYSVFKYCGGVNCRHYWEKLKVFKNKNGQKIIILADPTTYSEDLAAQSQNSRAPSPWGSIPNNARLNFKYQFSFDEDQRIVVGAVMIPNMKILRRDERGNPFYVFFSKSTIKKMAEKFLRDMNLHNTDINHDGNVVQSNTLLESWISESMQYDKSRHFGFALPVGTWFVSYKINDDETWTKIKNGELKGFSLAGDFYSKLIGVNKPTNMEQEIIDIISSIEEQSR